MATNRFRGDAYAVAQQTTLTPAVVSIGSTFTVTIGNKSITATATVATVANACAVLLAALQASTAAEFTEVTWTNETTLVRGTAVTAGVPFTLTPTTGGVGSPTLTQATPVASSGPNDWSTAANWSLGTVPVNTDDVVLDASTVAILYGLDQSAVTLTSLTRTASFSGQIGLPDYNASGSYFEYRSRYLAIKATTVTLGYGAGGGPSLERLNLSTAQSAVTVYNTGEPSQNGLPALNLLGTHASNALTIYKGKVGAAVQQGEVSTFLTITVGGSGGDANFYGGVGLTLGTLNQSAGNVTLNAAVTTVNKLAGSLYVMGTGAITTLNQDSGLTDWRSTGTITTANIGSTSKLDASNDRRAKTITTLKLFAGADYEDPYFVVTETNKVQLQQGATLANTTVNKGAGRTVAFT